jgi:purine-binding chemotaxis protein CheW
MLTEDVGSHQVLMLGLAGEVFALDARLIREILDPVAVTRVPGAKHFVSSVLNVRGKVIPLADLRQRFGMAPAATTADTRIIVIETDISGEPTTVGIIADKVHEVTELDHASLQAPPPVGMRWQPEFIAAIGKWKGDFIVVPNLERIFN